MTFYGKGEKGFRISVWAVCPQYVRKILQEPVAPEPELKAEVILRLQNRIAGCPPFAQTGLNHKIMFLPDLKITLNNNHFLSTLIGNSL